MSRLEEDSSSERNEVMFQSANALRLPKQMMLKNEAVMVPSLWHLRKHGTAR